jgi:MoaA/NifB/PqqE/SkfB family radical SAM enzyme
MTQLFKTTALSVDFVEDRRALVARGALALIVQPVLEKINDRLAEEKPALIKDGQIIASTWMPPIPSGPFSRLILNEAKAAIGTFVPQTVSIEVTRNCGCNCEHCTIKKGEGEPDQESIFKVIDQALDMGACIITFTEGDPLLRSDICELIGHVDPDKAVVNLFTPGLEMTKELADDLKDAGLYNLLIGVYSVDPVVHDGIRGLPGAFDKAVSAIRMGLEAGLTVTMATHVNSQRVGQIAELYELACSLGVQEFSIWEAIPRSPEECLSQIDKESIIRFYKKVNSTPGGPRVFSSTYFEGEMMGCLAGRKWLHVAADGNVRPCPYLPEEYGNVAERPLHEIWRDMRRSGMFNEQIMSCPAKRI